MNSKDKQHVESWTEQTVEQLKVVIVCSWLHRGGLVWQYLWVCILEQGADVNCFFWETDRCLLEGADGTCRQGTEACRFFQVVPVLKCCGGLLLCNFQ